jgi:hypothetical protein
MDLGILEEVDIRKIWEHEEKDFTPWLRNNITQLNQVLGLDIEITESEGTVGAFAVDLVGRDLGTGHTVIIENQLGPTDHQHLGQLLTYAAGRGAKIVIWISPHFREEHQQTLEWLNESTGEDQAFFGVEIKVVKIGESLPAPLFRLVSRPNEWQKTVSRGVVKTASGKGEAYQRFWATFLEKIKQRAPGLTSAKKGLPQNWYSIGAGRTGFAYSAAFKLKGQFGVELYIDTGDKEKNESYFDKLFLDKETIEKELGMELSWERLDYARACRVVVYREGSIDADEKELDSLQDWAVETVIKFHHVFSNRIKKL